MTQVLKTYRVMPATTAPTLLPKFASDASDPAGEPMIDLTLSQLAHAVGGELLLAAGDTPDTVVSGAVDTDSRLIGPGGIFVAKPGEETDGHLFVDAAVAARARSLAIVERPVDGIRHADRRAGCRRRARRSRPRGRRRGFARAATCGSSASPGRTARPRPRTSSPASSSPRARPSSPKASFNNEVGAPLTMLRVTDATRYLVSEFGASAPGEIARLAGLVEPDIGVVLMVGMAHAGGFGGIEATLAAKSELVRAIRPGGLAVLNADDARVASMASIAGGAGCRGPLVRRAAPRAVDVRADDVEVTASGTRSTVTVGRRDRCRCACGCSASTTS